ARLRPRQERRPHRRPAVPRPVPAGDRIGQGRRRAARHPRQHRPEPVRPVAGGLQEHPAEGRARAVRAGDLRDPRHPDVGGSDAAGRRRRSAARRRRSEGQRPAGPQGLIGGAARTQPGGAPGRNRHRIGKAMTTLTTRRARRIRAVKRNLTAYGFLCGALICFAFFSWYPMVWEIILSFQRTNFVDPPVWVGLENFVTVFQDPAFGPAWRNTVLFTLLALVIGYGVPFVVAIVLNELRHARAYLRFVVYLPVILPPAVIVLLFQWFYEPETGLFNTVLSALHLPTPAWLNSADTALISLVIVS